MKSTIFSRTQVAHRIAAACGVSALLFGAVACGDDSTPVEQGGAQAGAGESGQASGGQQAQRPGVNGLVAAVADGTAQVQSTDSGQVAVSWTGSTAFTKQVSAQLSDLSVGDCVQVLGASPGDDPQSLDVQPTEVTATAVTITSPVDGSCAPGAGQAAGRGGGAGARPDGADGGTDSRGTRPRGQAQGQGQGPGGATGAVTSVDAQGFVVEAVRFSEADADARETVEVTVLVSGATTYRNTVEGTADDVAVGQCLQADGTADDTGAVTATRIVVTPSTNGECADSLRRGGRPAGAAGEAS